MSRLRNHLDYFFIFSVWGIWLIATFLGERWYLFVENWFMSVTMAFGSFVAGATSQGGGAVAFPVMTLGFGIEPKPARDFSLMIQSIGMTSASFAIWVHRIKVERRALVFSGLGGVIGIYLGLCHLQQFFSPNPTKVFFVALWLAFGFALVLINRNHRAARLESIERPGRSAHWLLFGAGIAGGMVSGLLGSGLDILVFSVLVLGFGICEKVATPTSVVLMAGNSVAGFLIRLTLADSGPPIAPATWNYWWVCVPIVAIGAPFGAKFISRRGRAFLVGLLLFVILAQFVTALIVIPFDSSLIALALATFVFGVVLFGTMCRFGGRTLGSYGGSG